jgi:diacylglycerol kinase (ATP)
VTITETLNASEGRDRLPPPPKPVESDGARPIDATTRAAVVYNPIKVDLDAVKLAVRTQEKRSGWGASGWFPTSKEDPGYGATREALDSGASVIIAAGGDGTVRVVAETLRGSNAALALLPSGTGNLLARNLHLTLNDLDHAIETAFTGEDRLIDVGVIAIHREVGGPDEHAYLVMAGLGLDAKMLANTDDELKKRIGWLAYVRALADSLRDKNELRMRYNLDGNETRRIRAHTVIVGNCGALPANIVLLPDAAIDDGLFDVLIVRPEGVFGWFRIFGKVLWENGVLRRTKWGRLLMTKEISSLRYVKAETLSVTLDHPEEIELDGDGFGTVAGFDTWVDKGGLRVRVPRGWPLGRFPAIYVPAGS